MVRFHPALQGSEFIMSKKIKKKGSGKVLVLEIIILFAAILFVFLNRAVLFPQKPSPETPVLSPVVKLYQSKDIFSQIELKKQQVDPNITKDIYKNNDFINPVKENYFPDNARAEMNVPQDQLVPMKCLPEQIYLERKGKFAILPANTGNFESFTPIDTELLKLVDTLISQVKSGYTLAQFFACKTEDGRYIVKYNAIATDRVAYGFASETNPTAFFTQITPDGQIRDAAYISSDKAFCRRPIELTKSNLLYFECDFHASPSGTGRVTQADLYRIDLDAARYTRVTSCMYQASGNFCW